MPENDNLLPPRCGVDTSRPSPARLYNTYTTGKDSYPVDGQVLQQMKTLGVEAELIGSQNRKFHNRAVRAVSEMGIDQILDIGTGIPATPNTHEIAQAVLPASRILYVDNDRIVVRHAEALLASGPAGATHYEELDVREPETVLAAARTHLDLSRPVAVLMIALLHFVDDQDQDPRHIVGTVMSQTAPGSCLVLSHMVDDHAPDLWRTVEDIYRKNAVPAQIRPWASVHRFFDGLRLLDPGLVPVTQWRPADDDSIAIKPGRVPLYGAIAVKPS
jgi:hypothetical protein